VAGVWDREGIGHRGFSLRQTSAFDG
jgi:hypothetical protein